MRAYEEKGVSKDTANRVAKKKKNAPKVKGLLMIARKLLW